MKTSTLYMRLLRIRLVEGWCQSDSQVLLCGLGVTRRYLRLETPVKSGDRRGPQRDAEETNGQTA